MPKSSESSTPTFSPSETERWLRCPRLWHLEKTWKRRGNHDTMMLLGRAVGGALDLAYQGLLQGNRAPDVVESVTQAALRILTTGWEDDPEHTLEAMEKVVERCVLAGLSTDLLDGGTVVAVQKDLGTFIPDLIIRKASGGLRIVDHKFSYYVKPEWVTSRLEKQQTDVQLITYDMVVGDYYQEPVVDVGFHLIVAGPNKPRAYYDPISFLPAHRQMLHADLTAWWELLASHKRLLKLDPSYVPPGRLTACLSKDENFGRCSMYDACHLHNLDPQQMASLYRRKDR